MVSLILSERKTFTRLIIVLIYAQYVVNEDGSVVKKHRSPCQCNVGQKERMKIEKRRAYGHQKKVAHNDRNVRLGSDVACRKKIKSKGQVWIRTITGASNIADSFMRIG